MGGGGGCGGGEGSSSSSFPLLSTSLLSKSEFQSRQGLLLLLLLLFPYTHALKTVNEPWTVKKGPLGKRGLGWFRSPASILASAYFSFLPFRSRPLLSARRRRRRHRRRRRRGHHRAAAGGFIRVRSRISFPFSKKGNTNSTDEERRRGHPFLFPLKFYCQPPPAFSYEGNFVRFHLKCPLKELALN